jgi:DNA helicase II / ATP-dependent DNA helicase PcrA
MSPVGTVLPADLATELRALNSRQRLAAFHPGSVVIRAGPGSGKTRTLAAKVAYLLASVVPERRGVAAITYTNQAAREVIRRLGRLGLRPGRRLVSRTVHSWCLTAILQPYAHITGVPMPSAGGVIDDKAAEDLLRECLEEVGAEYERTVWEQPLITRIRRAIGAGYDASGFDEAKVAAASLFDERLAERDLIDYDAMVSRSLALVQRSPPVRDLLAARYPWLVVDEYQDLGPVLHELVLALHELAGIEICAVGDPDQSVMGFTGADPRYLEELALRSDFLDIALDLNYRCGSAIIAASHAALGETRDHRADPDRSDAGVVEPIAVTGGLADHADTTAREVEALISTGLRPERIAILYPRRGRLLDLVEQALVAAGIDYINERDQRLPSGPLVDFMRRCAARRIAGPQHCGYTGSGDQNAVAPTIGELTDEYAHLLAGADLVCPPRITVARTLESALDASQVEMPGDETIETLVALLDAALGLTTLAAASRERRDQTALDELCEVDEADAITLEQFAGPDLTVGKVVVTTYHSAKGREFSAVVLPGLVEGIVPRLEWVKSRRAYREPARAIVAEERRTFYVALTRASDAALLIHGPVWETEWGAHNELGPSRFVVDVVERLTERGLLSN